MLTKEQAALDAYNADYGTSYKLPLTEGTQAYIWFNIYRKATERMQEQVDLLARIVDISDDLRCKELKDENAKLRKVVEAGILLMTYATHKTRCPGTIGCNCGMSKHLDHYSKSRRKAGLDQREDTKT